MLESPLYAFVAKGWTKWSQEIVTLQAGKEDFLLYLVWTLDTIKEQEDGITAGLRDHVYEGLRDHFINRHFTSNKPDLDYLEKMRARDPLTRQRLTPVRDFRLTLVA